MVGGHAKLPQGLNYAFGRFFHQSALMHNLQNTSEKFFFLRISENFRPFLHHKIQADQFLTHHYLMRVQ